MKILRVLCAILAVGLVACVEPDYGTTPDITIASLGTPSNNEIWFTTTDGRDLMAIDESAFNVEVTDIIYSEYDVNVIRFAGELTTIDDNAFNGCYNLFNLALPNSVAEIGKRAFYDCKNMECLTLGSGLRHCHSMAFDGCFNLHSLHIPSIYNWCNITFDSPTANPLSYSFTLLINKSKIKNLTIPEGVEHISRYAFYNNLALTSVDMATSVKSIGEGAFYGCDNISKVSTNSVKCWCEIDFKNEEANPLSIAKVLYSKEAEVKDISLEGVEHIGSYAFINCTSITSLISDDALTQVGTDAFRNCSSLAKVELGSGVNQLGKQAFMNCKALKSVTCLAQIPPILGNNDVFSYNHEARKFYVPSVAAEAYKTDEMWSKYADAIEAIN